MKNNVDHIVNNAMCRQINIDVETCGIMLCSGK